MKLFLYILMIFSLSSCRGQDKPAIKIRQVPKTPKHFHISTKNEKNLIPFHNAAKKWGYLDAQTDSVVIPPRYTNVNLFQHGIAKVYQPNPKSKTFEDRSLIGFIDTRGNEIFKPQFTGIYKVEIKGNRVPEDSLFDLRDVYTNDGTKGVVELNLR